MPEPTCDEQPVPPHNLRLVHLDGTVIPVECRYDGFVDGLHRWVAVAPAEIVMRSGMSLRADLLPARSSISVEFSP